MPEVLFIADHLNTGGAPVVMRDLCVVFAKQGIKVTLVVLSDRVAHTLPDSVRVVRLPFTPTGWRERHQRYTHHARLLNEWLKDNPVDASTLVVAHLHHAHQVVARSRLSTQAWYCLHSNPAIAFLGNKRGWSRHLKRLKVRRLYQGHKLIGVSHGIIDALKQTFGVTGAPAVAIHNPLNLERIRTLGQANIDDVPEDYLLFVGRLEQRSKRFDRLLHAYADSGVTLPLLMIGNGEAHDAIVAEIERLDLQQRVHLLGHRENPYAYMQRAQAMILSSDYEGFPLVVAEALVCRTPVVSTDCPTGPREILTGELARYLVPLDRPDVFAAVLRDVVEQPLMIAENAMDRLSADNIARCYLALLKQS